MRITINGRQLEVEGKKTILEVARASRIFIPSLCDHPELAPFGGCRLCLVEIKGRRGYPPACSTFAEEGLEVVTETPELQAMRRQVLELILSEHPHACLICAEKKNCDDYKSTIRKVGEVTGCVLCPNNGRCQLQEVVEALKIDRVSFPALYRNFDVRRQDPFFDRNYNLCILCGRCVRVCHEVRGASAVSFVFRGSQAVVGTAFDRPLLESGCQFCGACVDVCPTGALTERATRGELLPAEERRTVCPLCSLGCELVVSLRDGRIVSSVAGDGESPNRGQVCVKGRFLVRDVVYSAKRILKPLIRREGKLEEANWEEALDFVAGKLQEFRGKDIALVGSTQVSIEDIHVLDKFARDVLATENIAFGPVFSPVAAFWRNLRENGLEPELNFEMSSLARADVILVAGADLGVSHPILWLEVFRSLRNGGKLVLIQDRETSLERHASFRLAAERGSEFAVFDRLSMRLLEKNPENPASLAGGYEEWREFLAKENRTLRAAPEGDEAGLEAVARLLNQSRETVFLLGPSLTSSPASRGNLRAFWNLAQLSAARILPLATEINERGALELRMRFRGPALFLDEILSRARAGAFRSLYLAGPLPGLPETAVDFLVIQDSYMNENVDRADAVLPATTFAESDGTFVNGEGRIQRFKKIIEPLGEARPDWWIISRLAQRMGAKNFNFQNASEILDELSQLRRGFEPASSRHPKKGKPAFILEEGKKTKLFMRGAHGGLKTGQAPSAASKELLGAGMDRYRSLNLLEESKGLRRLRGCGEE